MKVRSSLQWGVGTVIVLITILMCEPAAFSQDRTRLTSFTNEAKNFAFNISQDFLVDREGEEVRIYSYDGSTLITVLTDKRERPKKYVRDFKYPKDKITSSEKLEFNDFLVRRFEYETEIGFSTFIYAASSKDYFYISAFAKSKDNSAVTSFLQSIRVGGKPILVNSVLGPERDETPLIITEQILSSLVQTAVNRPHNTSTKVRYKSVNEKHINLHDIPYSRPLILLRKPKALYTQSARESNRQGTIRAKVDFLKDGQIGDIIVDARLDRGLGENVAKAIKQIKFIPAEVDGKTVDATRIFEYIFSVY